LATNKTEKGRSDLISVGEILLDRRRGNPSGIAARGMKVRVGIQECGGKDKPAGFWKVFGIL